MRSITISLADDSSFNADKIVFPPNWVIIELGLPLGWWIPKLQWIVKHKSLFQNIDSFLFQCEIFLYMCQRRFKKLYSLPVQNKFEFVVEKNQLIRFIAISICYSFFCFLIKKSVTINSILRAVVDWFNKKCIKLN